MNIKRNIIFAPESRKKDGIPVTKNVLTFTVFHLSLTMLPYFKTVKLDYGDNLT